MNLLSSPLLVFAALCGVTACGTSLPALSPSDSGVTPGADTGTPSTDTGPRADVGPRADAGTPTGDAAPPEGAGTCASPIDLAAEGNVLGGDLVLRGVTTGMTDTLHPYEGCVAHDAAEVVVSYRVPAGTGALMLTTEGSTYDTVLYVRTACSQAAGGLDTVCNNDSYDHAPQSTIYLTNLIEGQTIFIVVDGNTETDTIANGSFVLTARRVPFGGSGAPCHLVTDPPTTRCTAPLRCSEGGAADGTAVCVPEVATNTACDARAFTNVCLVGVTCVTDPAPAEGTTAVSLCSLPGTRRGAPCRVAEPRCDGAFACSAADPPACVPVVSIGVACDPTGEGNRCGVGTTCSPLGDGGASICH